MSQKAFDFAPLTGHTFGLAEKTAISTASPLLGAQTKLPNVTVWGKVYGHKADFVVVQCSGSDLNQLPQTFFSIDGGLTYSVLDKPAGEKDKYYQAAKGVYMGDPSYEYRVTDAISGAVVTLKESERLAWFIQEHDRNCRVAPRGALLQFEDGSVRRNVTFPGLDRSESGYLNNYVHIRQQRRAASRLEKDGVNANVDCFDALTDDIPLGVWALKYDGVAQVVYGVTAKFPGAVFYHVPETNAFGNVYLGDGAVCDVAFSM